MNDQTDHTSMLTGSEVLSLASVRGIYSEVSAHVKEKSKVVPTTSVAETLSEIQGLFNESQKIAYVGLCYTLIYNYKRSRFTLEYMEKIFVYLEFTTKGKLIMLMERKKFNSEFSISWSTAKRFGFKFDKGCKRRTKGCRKR
jgi:hypothetical protein